MFALRRFLGRRVSGTGNRDFREERGDFTIALMLFSVVLITAATVAYTWPKSSSTRFTAAHVATQALRAGIASVVADEVPSSESDYQKQNRCRARKAAQSVIDDYRIHGVVMNISDAGDEDPYDADPPINCDNLGTEPFLPQCVRTGDNTAYLRITIDWQFLNPGSLVGDVTRSRASAQEDIPPALVSALCPAA